MSPPQVIPSLAGRRDAPSRRNLTPGTVSVLYAAFATLWILASGELLDFYLDDPVSRGRVELLKGLGFVTVTSTLLYLLLRAGREPLAPTLDREPVPTNRHNLLVFVTLLALVPAAGYGVLALSAPAAERQALADLELANALSARQIESWLHARQHDAADLASDPAFSAATRADASADSGAVQGVLADLLSEYGFDAAALLDASGAPTLVVGKRTRPASLAPAAIHELFAERGIAALKLRLGEANETRVELAIALPAASVVLLLGASMEAYLHVLLHERRHNDIPIHTVLVRASDGAVLDPEQRRFDQQPGADARVAAGAAARADSAGSLSTIDAHGTRVLAAYYPLAETNWVVLSQLARAQVLGPTRALALWTSLIAFFAVSVISAVLLLLWREQRRAERLALAAQSAQHDRLLHRFFDLPFIGMAITAPGSRHWVRFNDCLCEMLGYTRDELAGMDWLQVTHPDELNEEITQSRQLMAGQCDNYQTQRRFVRKDGEIVHAAIDVKCIRSPDGAVDYFVAVVQDITQRVHTEQLLRDQALLYLELFEANPHPMYVYAIESLRFVAVNDAAVTHYGYSREEFLAMSITDIRPSEDVQRLREHIAARPQGGVDVAGIWRHRKRNGTLIDVEITAHAMNFNGQPAHLVLARDMTEQLRTQRRIQESDRFARATLDALAMHIAVLDEAGRIIATNQAWREFSSSNAGESAATGVGVSYLDTCEAAHAAGDAHALALLDGIGRVMRGEQDSFSHEYPCHAPHEERWFVARVSRFAGDGALRLVVAHENVTERKLAELDVVKLNRYYSALSKTNEAIIRSQDPDAMLHAVCRIAVEHGELELVWVGRIDPDSPVVTKLAAHGRAAPFLDEIFVSTDPGVSHGRGPFSVAVREGRTVVAEDFTSDARTAPWQAAAREWSLRAVLVCPIRRSAGVWGAIAFYASEPRYFNDELCRLLEELTADLAFSLDALETTRRRAEAEQQLLFNAKVLESSHEGMFITDHENRYAMVNRAFCEITGYSREELLGNTPSLLKSNQHDETFYRELWSELLRTGHWEGEIWDRRKNGEVFPSWLAITRVDEPARDATFHTAIFSDITERKAAEQRIVHLASHDLLTNLPNRMLLGDRIATAIRHAARRQGRLGVLFVDLDRFKPINDVLGHEIGDRLLKAVASRISDTVRASDTVARVGGDEFVVLLYEISSSEDAARVAEKIIAEMCVPYALDDHEMVLSASIGIAMYPEDGQDAVALIGLADTAMFSAKEAGRNAYRFYTDEMGARAAQRLSLERDLRGACARGEISVAYQPQVDLSSGQVVAMEALARWSHPVLGMVSPGRFIPVAEDSGQILEIGEWMLNAACRQLQTWRERGVIDVPVAVNVSAIQFRQADFTELVTRTLHENGLPATRLELEVTESVVMGGAQEVIDKLNALHALGVRLAIDDFGTGYSSLSYLRRFPAQRLKIDYSFVHDLPQDQDSAAIARAVVSLGRSLGMSTVAEGVETEEQAEFLRAIWCTEAQGYLYAKPMSAVDFEAWLEARVDKVEQPDEDADAPDRTGTQTRN